MAEQKCAFCNLEDEKSRIISTGKQVTSFLANPRLTPGHSLVIPNRHVESILDLTKEEAVEIYNHIQALYQKMLGSMAQGVDVWHKFRPKVLEGNRHKMDHLHIHVLPSNPGDKIYEQAIDWGGTQKPMPEGEREELLQLLQN